MPYGTLSPINSPHTISKHTHTHMEMARTTEMGKLGSFWRLCLVLIVGILTKAKGQPLVPALFIFGDSSVDAGNNNYIETILKADFLPYGRDFNNTPTGRFCNGKLASDFTAENLGFTSYPPAYLSKEAAGNNLLTGVNFASAASGYYDKTSKLYDSIPLSQQLKYYKDYQKKLVAIAGKSNASSIISGSVYFLSSGSTDFLINYYINPLLYKVYTTDQFSDILLQGYSDFIKGLYGLGARKIGVSTLPPLGCVPAAITIFGEDSNGCVTKINQVATTFNNKLNVTSQKLQTKLSGLKLVLFDIYQPFYDLVKKPTDFGLYEARKACCGTGVVETSFLCNSKSVGTCSNASEYVFWDSVHPTEAANKILAADLLASGISLIS